jgi:hypothetical protein
MMLVEKMSSMVCVQVLTSASSNDEDKKFKMKSSISPSRTESGSDTS